MLEKVVFDKISKEAPTSKLITPSVLVERFKINASLARRVLKVCLCFYCSLQSADHHFL